MVECPFQPNLFVMDHSKHYWPFLILNQQALHFYLYAHCDKFIIGFEVESNFYVSSFDKVSISNFQMQNFAIFI